MTRRRNSIMVVVGACIAVAGAVACSSILGIQDTTDVPGNDGGVGGDAAPASDAPSGSGDGNDNNNASDAFIPDDADIIDQQDADIELPVDAGDDGGDNSPVDAGCLPTTAFIPKTGATGTVCNLANVLPQNAGATGLDFTNNVQELAVVDGRNVTACIGVDFPTGLTQVTVRASSPTKACDRACIGSFCGTGNSAYVFGATANGPFTYLKTLSPLSTAYADFPINIPASLSGVATRIIVCRTGWSGERNDVNVYAVSGQCVP